MKERTRQLRVHVSSCRLTERRIGKTLIFNLVAMPPADVRSDFLQGENDMYVIYWTHVVSMRQNTNVLASTW